MSTSSLNPTAASLLGFLHRGPLTGWDLDAWVRISIGNFWNVTRSQVYRELRSLAEQGLVDAGPSGRRDSTPYTITEQGKEAFAAWIAGDPGADIIRSRLLLTVFFGDHVEPNRFLEIVRDQLRVHEAQLGSYETMAPSLAGERFMAATLHYGIAHERAVVDWLRQLEVEAVQLGGGGA